MAEASLALREPYALATTLFSGQAFRWRAAGDAFRGWVAGEPVVLRAAGDTVLVEAVSAGTAEEGAAAYLRVRDPMRAIYRSFGRDPPVAAAVRRWRGLHLLAQDPWETTASFIASSASNIPRISRTVEALCGRFGKRSPGDGRAGRAFPTPSAIARAPTAALLACGLGYRAPYLRATARAVHRGDLDLEGLRALPTDAAREALVETLDGVGPKVADCILLFSLGKDDAFPVDRWVARHVAALYQSGEEMAPARVASWGRDRFGRWAGYAQQYLFQDARGAGVRTRPRSRSP